MQRAVMSVVAFSIVILAYAGSAVGADDHLKCYKVKDPLLLKGPAPSWLDLTGPEFGTEQCSIVGGFRLLCTPVTKTVTAPIERKFVPPGSTFVAVPPNQAFQAFTPEPFAGEPQTEDKLCYKIKCTSPMPSPPNPGANVADQFGNRQLTKLQPYLLCGPVIDGTRFTFQMDGNQETPPTGSLATGSCVGILSADHTSFTLSCTHNVTSPIAAHIHQGGPGIPGPIIHPLPGVGASPINDVWNGSSVPPLTPADVANLLSGQLYVNVHSSSFIGGEIRGQIVE